MSRYLRCRDLGPDCDFVARGETDDGVMEQVAGHARTVHGIDPIPQDMARQARLRVRDERERHDPPRTTTGVMTAPRFGSAGSGGLEYERLPERHGPDGSSRR